MSILTLQEYLDLECKRLSGFSKSKVSVKSKKIWYSILGINNTEVKSETVYRFVSDEESGFVYNIWFRPYFQDYFNIETNQVEGYWQGTSIEGIVTYDNEKDAYKALEKSLEENISKYLNALEKVKSKLNILGE